MQFITLHTHVRGDVNPFLLLNCLTAASRRLVSETSLLFLYQQNSSAHTVEHPCNASYIDGPGHELSSVKLKKKQHFRIATHPD